MESKGTNLYNKGSKDKSVEEKDLFLFKTSKKRKPKDPGKNCHLLKNAEFLVSKEKGTCNIKSLKKKINIKKYLISTLYLKKNFLIKKLIKKSQLIPKKFFKKN